MSLEEYMTVLQKITVPDIGGANSVDVIELLVKSGDKIEKETPLITLESDKATMEIPSPMAGVIASIEIKIGDKVSEGDLILMLEPDVAVETSAPIEEKTQPIAAVEEEKPVALVEPVKKVTETLIKTNDENANISAGPSVRRLARTLGVDLSDVQGSGRKERVSKEDIEQYVKEKLSNKAQSGSLQVAAMPEIDFSKFGEIEIKPLTKIKRLTGVSVHRSWVNIPHVTQFDSADITELEAFRKQELESSLKKGYKLTLLSFVCKAVVKALEAFPQFNSSLDASMENLIYKQYFNIGIAIETPNGLVVAVIKDVNRLTVGEIALEMTRLSNKARDKGLSPSDMSGGCFTISSLGGIGGHAFTPIVNSPEVAILGLSKASINPIYKDGEFVPRLILPLSLSYDHRVIDGAEAARFTRFISEMLGDIRRVLI